MPDYILLMHDDTTGLPDEESRDDWSSYIRRLQSSGNFQGGSAIGGGVCLRKIGVAPTITPHLSGYIRVTANDLEHARALLLGNPVFESGGTVEIRELPRTD